MMYRMMRRAARRGSYNRRPTQTTTKQAPQNAKVDGRGALKGLLVIAAIVGGVLLIDHHVSEEYAPKPVHVMTTAQAEPWLTQPTIGASTVTDNAPSTVSATVPGCTLTGRTVTVSGTLVNVAATQQDIMEEVHVQAGKYATVGIIVNQQVPADTTVPYVAKGTLDGPATGVAVCSVEVVT